MKPHIGPVDSRHFSGKERDSHFSWLRTRLSLERTLMSVMRTATALIGFGFTIFQFFDKLNEMDTVQSARHPEVIAAVSMAMVGAGVLMLLIAIYEFRQGIHHLWSEDYVDIAGFTTQPRMTPMYYSAVFLVLVGVGVLATVLWRMLAV